MSQDLGAASLLDGISGESRATVPPSAVRLWVRHTRPVPAGVPRLLCLPAADRGATMFEDWPVRLAPAVEAWPVQLPGREDRAAEPPIAGLDDLSAALLEAFYGCLDTPYALMGFGMGATTAVVLAFRARVLGVRAPAHLFVAGQAPPHLPGSAYECVPDPALTSPITVFDDETVPAHLLMAWGRLTHGAFRVRPAGDMTAQIRAAVATRTPG